VLLIAVLSGFFTSRDQGTVTGPEPVPGRAFRDLGDALLKPGEPAPHYDSSPPTSGPHLPAAVPADQTQLDDNQLLDALASGDVVVAYGSSAPPPGLTALARALAPQFSPQLALVGDAVILDHRPGTAGLIGLAWAHMIRVPTAADPRLRGFAAFWLGRAAPRR
jgi:hypothetical protein